MDRTLAAFVEEVRHQTGEPLALKWRFWRGTYLVLGADEGAVYEIGGSKWQVLSPIEQESICRALQREDWIVLLGLRPIDDD